MKNRVTNIVQYESTHGVLTTNTCTKQQNIQTETCLKTNTTYYTQFPSSMHISLSRPELLEACKRGATQNTNESFHNVVRAIVRETQFCSLTTLWIAPNLAVAKYNLGFTAGVSRCFVAITGLEAVSSCMMSLYTGLDPDSVEHSAWRIKKGGGNI